MNKKMVLIRILSGTIISASVFSVVGITSAQEISVGFLRVTTYNPQFSISRDIGTATFLGNIRTRTDGLGANYWFEWGTSPTLGKVTSSGLISGRSGGTNKDIKITIKDLDPDAFYYYKASAKDPTGTSHGDIVRFRMRDGFTTNVGGGGPGIIALPLGSTSIYNTPKVTTLVARVFDSKTAVLSGFVTTDANLSTSGYFEWGPTLDLEFQTPVKQIGSLPNMDFSEVLNNLNPNTLYYYRAVSANLGGQTRGVILTFVTVDPGILVAPVTSALPESSVGVGVSESITSEVSANVPVPNLNLLETLFGGKSKVSEEVVIKEEIDTPGAREERDSEKLSLAQVLFGTSSGFFPSTLFGWVLLGLVMLALLALVFYLMDSFERVRESRERKQDVYNKLI